MEPQALRSILGAAEQASEQQGSQPALLQFGYVEQRHEDRYKVALAAEVNANGKTYPAKTRDISVRGLCIELAATPGSLYRGDQVRITFPGLQKRARFRVKHPGCTV
jgi:hypothetical protein